MNETALYIYTIWCRSVHSADPYLRYSCITHNNCITHVTWLNIVQIFSIHLLRPPYPPSPPWLVCSLTQALEFIGVHPTGCNSNWCVQLRTRKNPIYTSWIRGWRRRRAHLWAWSALVTSMALGLWSEESWSLQCNRHSRCEWVGWSDQSPLTEKAPNDRLKV